MTLTIGDSKGQDWDIKPFSQTVPTDRFDKKVTYDSLTGEFSWNK